MLGHEFCGTVAQGRARGARRQGRRPRRQRDRRRDLRHLPDVPHRPLQPVPDAQGLRLRRQRRDGALRRPPARCLHAIPDTLPFEYACLASRTPSPTSRCASTRRSAPATWWWCSVPGPIGLLCTRMAALAGANPLIVAGLPQDAPRLEAARALGATHTIDVSTGGLESSCAASTARRRPGLRRVGRQRPLDAALKLVRPGGQVTKVGWSPDTIPVDINPLVGKAVTLQGSFSHNFPVWERVIHLLDHRHGQARDRRRPARPARRLAPRLRRDARRRRDQVGAAAASAEPAHTMRCPSTTASRSITGSTSGIGQGIAEHFAALGARVVVHGLEAGRRARIVDATRARGGRRRLRRSRRSRRARPCAALVRGAVERFGGIDILVNNAASTARGYSRTRRSSCWDAIMARQPARAVHAAAGSGRSR